MNGRIQEHHDAIVSNVEAERELNCFIYYIYSAFDAAVNGEGSCMHTLSLLRC